MIIEKPSRLSPQRTYVCLLLSLVLAALTLPLQGCGPTYSRPPVSYTPSYRPPRPIIRKAPSAHYEWEARNPRRWKYIVVHHSATPTGNAASFDKAHRKRGWRGLGYHFVIGNGSGSADGLVEVGFRWKNQEVGAHARSTNGNEYNKYGIGICLVGNFDNSRPTSKQLTSLWELIEYLQRKHSIPSNRVIRHNEVKTTACPGCNFPYDKLVFNLSTR